jgi:hypothetical protein
LLGHAGQQRSSLYLASATNRERRWLQNKVQPAPYLELMVEAAGG